MNPKSSAICIPASNPGISPPIILAALLIFRSTVEVALDFLFVFKKRTVEVRFTLAPSSAFVLPKRVLGVVRANLRGSFRLPVCAINWPAPGCPLGILSNCAATCRPNATLPALFLRVRFLVIFCDLLLRLFLGPRFL